MPALPLPRPAFSLQLAFCVGLLALLAGCGPAQVPPEFGGIEGLQVLELREGEGEAARPGQRIHVHYVGHVYDQREPGGRGAQFDASRPRGEPFRFLLGAGQVIRGWDQGLEGLRVGGILELRFGPEFGYGDRGAGRAIPPGASLVFEVELIAVED